MAFVLSDLKKLKSLPNKLTLIRVLAVPVLIGLYPIVHEMVWFRVICAIIFLVAAFTDFLDGYLARKYHHVSKLGAVIDPIADKLLVGCSVVILLDAQYISALSGGLIICRELAIGGLRAAAVELGFSIKVSNMGKVKTFLQVVAFFVLLLHFSSLETFANMALLAAILVSYVSASLYINEFWKRSKKEFVDSKVESDATNLSV